MKKNYFMYREEGNYSVFNYLVVKSSKCQIIVTKIQKKINKLHKITKFSTNVHFVNFFKNSKNPNNPIISQIVIIPNILKSINICYLFSYYLFSTICCVSRELNFLQMWSYHACSDALVLFALNIKICLKLA